MVKGNNTNTESKVQSLLDKVRELEKENNRLNDKLAAVMGGSAYGAHPPTASAIEVRNELTAAVDAELEELDTVLGPELEAFNAKVAAHELPAVDAGGLLPETSAG